MNDMMWYRSASGRSLRRSGAGLTPLRRLREGSPRMPTSGRIPAHPRRPRIRALRRILAGTNLKGRNNLQRDWQPNRQRSRRRQRRRRRRLISCVQKGAKDWEETVWFNPIFFFLFTWVGPIYGPRSSCVGYSSGFLQQFGPVCCTKFS